MLIRSCLSGETRSRLLAEGTKNKKGKCCSPVVLEACPFPENLN